MTSVRSKAKGLWPLFLAVALFVAAGSLQNALVGYQLAAAGMASGGTSLLIALYFGGFLCGAYSAPRLVRRYGQLRAFAGPAIICGLALTLYTQAASLPSIAILQLVTGFGIACQYVVVESWLNLEADSNFRARLFGLYMIFWFAAAAGGPLLITLGEGNLTALFLLAGAMVVASGLLAARLRGQEWRGTLDMPMPLSPVWRGCPVGFLATLLVGVSFGAVLGLTAAYGQHRGLDAAGTSVFVAAFIIGGALTQYLAGTLSDRFGRMPVLFAFTLLATVAAILLLAARTEPMLYLAAFAFGGLALPIYALGVAQVQDGVDEAARVSASGGLLILNGFGSFAGPLVIAAMNGLLGPDALFIVLALSHGLLALAIPFAARLPTIGANATD